MKTSTIYRWRKVIIMTSDYFEELRKLVVHLLDLSAEEYTVISELLSELCGYMDTLSNIGEIRQKYIKRLEQLEQLRKDGEQFLRMLDEAAYFYSCAKSEPLSAFDLSDVEIPKSSHEEDDEAQASLEEDEDSSEEDVESSDEALDSHEETDGEKTEIEAAKTITESSSDAPANDVPASDSNADSSTSDAIAHLRERLAADKHIVVDSDGNVLNPSDSMQADDGVIPVKPGVLGDGYPSIPVPAGKLAGRPEILFQSPSEYCPHCGAEVDLSARFCPKCGSPLQPSPQCSPEREKKAGTARHALKDARPTFKHAQPAFKSVKKREAKRLAEQPTVTLDRVQFSAVAPKTFVKGSYSIIDVLMYEDAFRGIVDEVVANADEPVKETKSGKFTAKRNAKIKVILSSPDVSIEDNTEVQTWQGEYLRFSFAVELPEQYQKKQILFVATVYINDLIATRLKFVAKCNSFFEQKIKVTRDDVLSAFMSYARQARSRVAAS
ncbi:MAG: zinc-ribbon domain-containing protein, partial [Clostridiales bacterium]|nr:zinc-ribbon domain-containing protein [Clostridiales bacterium]